MKKSVRIIPLAMLLAFVFVFSGDMDSHASRATELEAGKDIHKMEQEPIEVSSFSEINTVYGGANGSYRISDASGSTTTVKIWSYDIPDKYSSLSLDEIDRKIKRGELEKYGKSAKSVDTKTKIVGQTFTRNRYDGCKDVESTIEASFTRNNTNVWCTNKSRKIVCYFNPYKKDLLKETVTSGATTGLCKYEIRYKAVTPYNNITVDQYVGCTPTGSTVNDDYTL